MNLSRNSERGSERKHARDLEKQYATDASRNDLAVANLDGCHYQKHRSLRQTLNYDPMTDGEFWSADVPYGNTYLETAASAYETLYPILRTKEEKC